MQSGTLQLLVEHSRGRWGPHEGTDTDPWLTWMQALTNIGWNELRTKQRSVIRTGVSQRSNVLGGMAKKDRLLVSDLIKTHWIIVIIVKFQPEQWDEPDETHLVAHVEALESHKMNLCSFCKLPWYPSGLFSSIPLTVCLAAGDRFK